MDCCNKIDNHIINGFPRFNDISVCRFSFWENHLKIILLKISTIYIRNYCFLFQTDISINVVKLNKIKNINNWLSKNKWEQPTLNMCWTSCIKMIIKELSDRHKISRLNLRLRDINRIFKYNKLDGAKIEGSVDVLSSKIDKLGYRAQEIEGVEQLDKLNSILLDEDKSFPIVCFGPDYLKEQKGPKKAYNVPGSPDYYDHIVMIINIEDKIKIVDPFTAFLLKSTYVNKAQSFINKTKFLYHWSTSRTPYWIMWIEKKNKSGPIDKWI